MKIAFKKLAKSTPKEFECLQNGADGKLENALKLSGSLVRLDSQIVKLEGTLRGDLELICARSGESFIKTFNEPLVLYISDGLWDTQSQSVLDSFDVIEFFDGFIDVDFILYSEIESTKSDYHIKGE